VLFGLEPVEAIEAVDACSLWPAFNLAVLDSNLTQHDGRRRLIRVWRGAVETFRPGESAPKADVAGVITAVLPPLGVAPPASVTVRAVELAYRWSVSRIHIARLISARELKEVGRHDPVNESPRVSYDSAKRFLEARIL
jgi:hypothetical protein